MLDIEDRKGLENFLRQAGWNDQPLVAFQVLAGGVSSKVVLVAFAGGSSWVLKQSLPKLRVEVDWFSDPARIHREALGLRWLAERIPKSVPRFLFESEPDHVFAMEALTTGFQNWKSMLLRGEVDLDRVRSFGSLLGCIHADAWTEPDRLDRAFRDRTFFESLRLEPYYEYSAVREPRAARFLADLLAQTRSIQTTLVHGDFSPKNILVSTDRMVLLDHEVIHLGDPAFDVGFAVAHLASKLHHLPAHRDRFANALREFHAAYMAKVGGLGRSTDLESRCVRHSLGCFLARAIGRSTLEYLDQTERARQRDVCTRLMASPPESMAELFDAIRREIEREGG